MKSGESTKATAFGRHPFYLALGTLLRVSPWSCAAHDRRITDGSLAPVPGYVKRRRTPRQSRVISRHSGSVNDAPLPPSPVGCSTRATTAGLENAAVRH